MLKGAKVLLWTAGNIGVTVLALYNVYAVGAGFFNEDIGTLFFVLVLFVAHRAMTVGVFACAFLAMFIAPWGLLTGSAFVVAWLLAKRIDPEFSSNEEAMFGQSG